MLKNIGLFPIMIFIMRALVLVAVEIIFNKIEIFVEVGGIRSQTFLIPSAHQPGLTGFYSVRDLFFCVFELRVNGNIIHKNDRDKEENDNTDKKFMIGKIPPRAFQLFIFFEFL